MRRLIIDCQKGEVWQDLTPQEEAARLAEIQQAVIEEVANNRRINKAQLIRVLAELREMRQNRDVFDDEDIAAKQAEVDDLKQKIRG